MYGPSHRDLDQDMGRAPHEMVSLRKGSNCWGLAEKSAVRANISCVSTVVTHSSVGVDTSAAFEATSFRNDLGPSIRTWPVSWTRTITKLMTKELSHPCLSGSFSTLGASLRSGSKRFLQAVEIQLNNNSTLFREKKNKLIQACLPVGCDMI